jgi:Fe-S-cluster-containing dehydrogenase component
MSQKILYIDTRRCMNCRACETACKLENGIPAGPRWMMVQEIEVTVDGVDKTEFLPMPCLQCGDPLCLKACPVGAISKRTEDGIVLVKKNKCIGCHQCLWACPFGAPQFGFDGKMEKCTLCVHRLDDGLTTTACQVACQAEAILVGTVEEISNKIRERYANSSRQQLFGAGISGR